MFALLARCAAVYNGQCHDQFGYINYDASSIDGQGSGHDYYGVSFPHRLACAAANTQLEGARLELWRACWRRQARALSRGGMQHALCPLCGCASDRSVRLRVCSPSGCPPPASSTTATAAGPTPTATTGGNKRQYCRTPVNRHTANSPALSRVMGCPISMPWTFGVTSSGGMRVRYIFM